MKKRGIYQQLSGGKEQKVANSIKSLKRKMRFINGKAKPEVTVKDGKNFKIYYPSNQAGVPFVVKEEKSHNCSGYQNKTLKKKIGPSNIIRVKLEYPRKPKKEK